MTCNKKVDFLTSILDCEQSVFIPEIMQLTFAFSRRTLGK